MYAKVRRYEKVLYKQRSQFLRDTILITLLHAFLLFHALLCLSIFPSSSFMQLLPELPLIHVLFLSLVFVLENLLCAIFC